MQDGWTTLSDCAFGSFKFNEDAQMYPGVLLARLICWRSTITRALPAHFAKSPEDFVPSKIRLIAVSKKSYLRRGIS